MKLRKNLLIVGSVLLTLVIAALIAPVFINSNNLKSTIEQLTLKQAGYKLTIAGDIDIRLLPSARIRLSDVTLASPAAAQTPFAKIKTLDVGVKLMPLLSGTVEVTRLAFQSPDINLIKTAGGNNWDSVVQKTAVAKTLNDKSKPKEESTLVAPGFILYQFDINDGRVAYKDAVSQTNVLLEKLDADSSMSSLEDPLKINAKLLWNGQPVKIAGRVDSLRTLMQSKETLINFDWGSDLLKLKFDGKFSQVHLFGNANIKSPSIAATSSWLAGKTSDQKQTAIPLEIEGVMDCSLSKCSIADMKANIDKMRMEGKVALILSAPVHVIADLKMDRLDITPYLAKKTASLSLISNAWAASGRWSDAPIDVAVLQTFNANVSIAFNEFVAGAFKTGKGIFRAKNERNLFSAEMVDTALYNGTASVFVNLEHGSRIDGRASIKDIALEPLLNSLVENNRFSGAATSQFAFVSILRSEKSLVENLNGSGTVKIKDGSIRGLDIAGMVRNVQSLYKQVDKSQQKTDFSEMSGNFTIQNGIVRNDDLAMKAPLFRVSGKGSVNLPAYTINYLLTPQIVETIQGQGGKEKEGLGVPILVSGDLSNPTYAPDAKGLIEDAIKNPEKLKDKVNQVKGLFKTPKTNGFAPGTSSSPAPKGSGTTQQPEKPMNQIKNLLKGI